MSKKLQKKNKQSINFQGIIAFFGAVLGVISPILFMHHTDVVSYRPNDVSDTIGVWFALGSWICWITYVVLYAVKALQQKHSLA